MENVEKEYLRDKLQEWFYTVCNRECSLLLKQSTSSKVLSQLTALHMCGHFHGFSFNSSFTLNKIQGQGLCFVFRFCFNCSKTSLKAFNYG